MKGFGSGAGWPTACPVDVDAARGVEPIRLDPTMITDRSGGAIVVRDIREPSHTADEGSVTCTMADDEVDR